MVAGCPGLFQKAEIPKELQLGTNAGRFPSEIPAARVEGPYQPAPHREGKYKLGSWVAVQRRKKNVRGEFVGGDKPDVHEANSYRGGGKAACYSISSSARASS
jgi:hypothetical protein